MGRFLDELAVIGFGLAGIDVTAGLAALLEGAQDLAEGGMAGEREGKRERVVGHHPGDLDQTALKHLPGTEHTALVGHLS